MKCVGTLTNAKSGPRRADLAAIFANSGATHRLDPVRRTRAVPTRAGGYSGCRRRGLFGRRDDGREGPCGRHAGAAWRRVARRGVMRRIGHCCRLCPFLSSQWGIILSTAIVVAPNSKSRASFQNPHARVGSVFHTHLHPVNFPQDGFRLGRLRWLRRSSSASHVAVKLTRGCTLTTAV